MHFTVTSTADLTALREQLRAGLLERGVAPRDVDDVVLATHEVAAGALAGGSTDTRRPEGRLPAASLAVRWLVVERPRREVHVTLRATNLSFTLGPVGPRADGDVRSSIVRAVAGRVDVEPLIGGTVIRLRRVVP